MNQTIEDIVQSLTTRRIEAAPLGDTINAVLGRGPTAHRANLDLGPLLASLSADSRRARWIEGFTNGVYAVMCEPPRSKAATWDFPRAAGRIVINLDVGSFTLGVQAASTKTPYVLPFVEDLVFTFCIELDRGIRALTQEQVALWGVSADRIKSAARSLLYHRTSGLPWLASTHLGVQEIRVGDDCEAVRAIVFADAFFHEVDAKVRFGMPSQDRFLFVQNPESVPALEAAINQSDEARLLTRSVFRFERGQPVISETL